MDGNDAPVRPRRTAGRLAHLPPEYLPRLERQRGKAKGQSVMASLGISDNSWRKIRAGIPVRASVIERLVQRLAVTDERSHDQRVDER